MHMCFASTTSGNFTTLQTFGTPTHGWMLLEEATDTTTPPTVIPDEHDLHREEILVSLLAWVNTILHCCSMIAVISFCGTVVQYTVSVVALLNVSVAWERDTA